MRALSGKPAYQQVADDLRRQIADGTMAVGAQLPTATKLMKRYDVSSTVVKAAINQLKIEGLVVGQQGRGVFVRRRASLKADSGGPEFAEVMGHLRTIRADLAQLNDRLARVEGLVADEPPRPR